MTSAPDRGWNPGARRQRWLAALVIALVIAFQSWTAVGLNPPRLFGAKQSDYYNLLMHAFLGGHTYLHLTPDPRLALLKNPYDPTQRPDGVGVLHDGSYYQGRYYIYFGVAPVVTLWLPWRLVTGHDLPQPYAILFFTATGFLASAVLWLSLRRRYFPDSGSGALVAILAVLGLGSMTHAVLRRADMWEAPIAAAYCFGMLTLLCLYHCLHGRRPAGWMAAAGACFGLAVGSRPNYVVGAAAFLVPLGWAWWRRRGGDGTIRLGRLVLALAGSLGAVAAGLLWYNYVRFGNPLEFGTGYMVNANYEITERHFSLGYVHFNTFIYYLSPAQWSRYFPFVEMIHPPVQPDGYYGIEYCYGLLVNFPFCWFALLAPLAWWRRPPVERAVLRAFLAAVALFFLPIAGLLLLRLTAAARYMVDFTPTFMLLAGVGLLAAERATVGWGRAAVRTLGGATAAFTVFVGVMLSFQLHELIRQLAPDTYRGLAHAFDEPVYALERLAGGVPGGPLELTVRFPRGRTGKIEPLLTTGWEYYSDNLYVMYEDDHRVRIGFDHLSGGRLVTAPFTIDFDAPHVFHIEMGSLYPPPAHPFFDGKSPAEVAALTHHLFVTLDGHPLFDVPSPFYDAAPEGRRLGLGPDGYYGWRFSGQILAVRSVPPAPHPAFNVGSGAMEVEMSFPDKIPGLGMPIVSTGVPGHGDVLRVRWVRPGWARFGYDDWGTGLCESDDIPIEPGVHDLFVRLPSLLPAGGGPLAEALRESLLVELDGRPVWVRRVAFSPARERDAFFGHNGIGASSTQGDLKGMALSVARVPGRESPAPARGPLRLRVQLPRDRPGASEPLVTTGLTGRADILSIQYVDAGHVSFALDHWASSYQRSAPVAIDYGRLHDIEIQLPTLDWTAPTDGRKFDGEIRILVDGAVAWRAPEEFYRSAPDTLEVAANRIGASSCTEAFTGGIVSIEGPAAR